MFPLRIVPYVIYASETSDVQCAQRVASIGMVLLQDVYKRQVRNLDVSHHVRLRCSESGL